MSLTFIPAVYRLRNFQHKNHVGHGGDDDSIGGFDEKRQSKGWRDNDTKTGNRPSEVGTPPKAAAEGTPKRMHSHRYIHLWRYIEIR
jgi:hypothetical protein